MVQVRLGTTLQQETLRLLTPDISRLQQIESANFFGKEKARPKPSKEIIPRVVYGTTLALPRVALKGLDVRLPKRPARSKFCPLKDAANPYQGLKQYSC